MLVQLPPIELDNIQQVTFFKRDELTTDLICCEIAVSESNGGQTYFFHEEAEAWSAVIALVEQLPGFDQKWREKVVHPAFAENRTTAFRRGK
jgi:hypothetical protein